MASTTFMDTTTLQPPTINLNVLIQNYINIQTSSKDSFTFDSTPNKKFRSDVFPNEFAKQYEPDTKPRRPISPLAISPILSSPDSLSTFSDALVKKPVQIYEQREELKGDDHLTEIVGFFLIGFSAFLFVAVFYALIISPLVGSTGHMLLDFIRKDNYYCMLIPLMIPVTIFLGYVNWVSIKFFRHS